MKKTIIAIAAFIAMASCTKTTVNNPTTDTKKYTVNLKPSILFDGHQLRANLISDIIPNNVIISADVSYDWDSAKIFNNHYIFKKVVLNKEQNLGYANRANWTVTNIKIDTAWSDNVNVKLIY